MSTKTETKHSPLPWYIANRGMPGPRLICATYRRGQAEIALVVEDSEYVDRLEAAANSELIVRAVNSHDELVAACEAALSFVGDDGSGEELANQLRATLAKAKP